MHFPVFLICLVFLVFIPPCLSNFDGYTSCGNQFNCGSITDVDYPFWGQDRPYGCGYPGLQLNCDEHDAATIDIMKVKYRVLDINPNTQTLKIAREDYMEGICPSQFVNTTLDFTLFNYAPGYMNLTFFYGCSPVSNAIFDSFSPCVVKGSQYAGIYVLSGVHGPANCTTSVVVPVSQEGMSELGFAFANSSGLDQLLRDGFEVKWKVDGKPCSECTKSMGKCGYNLNLNRTSCFCPNQNDGLTTCLPSPAAGAAIPVGLTFNKKIIIGIGGSVAISIFLICFFGRKFWLKKIRVLWRKEIEGDQDVEESIRKCGLLAPKRYSYSDVKKMTNSFKDKLGQGGFGQVYKGQLHDGRVVAVKLLSESKGNGEEFMNEVASISRTSHVNIVALSGFCYERTKRALIYEFMRNGSLDKFIYDGPDKTSHPLGWEMLYQIALGIARGLEYLHRGCNTRILHFDIKPHNILLDEDFCPKISDFGLAKLCQRKESIISLLGARGTVGYIAPEVFSRNFGGVSHKSDVYSYGMMVLEMVGARKKIEIPGSRTSEIYFPHWIYEQLDLGMDLIHDGVMTEKEGEISRKLVLVGLWCIQTIPSDRPSMNKVIEMLEGSLQSLQVPPKPFLSSPPRQPRNSSTTSSMIDDSS